MTIRYFSFLLVTFFAALIPDYATAKVIDYDKGRAVSYAQKFCGTNAYNMAEYKCWNGTKLDCENHSNKGGNGKKTDCANFVSQALIDGGIDFNVYATNSSQYVVTPVNISKTSKKIGFPRVRDLTPVLEASYCFEKITNPLMMQIKAKPGDVLSSTLFSHVVVYAGDKKYLGHTTDTCSGTYNGDDIWKYNVLYHFQDDNHFFKCFQYDGTILARLRLMGSSASSTTSSGPGGDHPDDTTAVGTGTTTNEALFNKNGPIGILDNGFPSDMQKVLSLFNREARLVPIDGVIPSLVAEMPLLIIPSGGLSGLSDSQFFKTALEEYVKNGGSVLMLSQQHGYEYSAIPGGIGGYGWTEDQNCQANSSYIDTWHQMLAGQTNATPSLNVDGYFTSIPANAAVLLRRTANGQPALITYPYGNGRIIATSVYTDFAYSFSQAGSEEISLIRDIVSWAAMPTELQEIKPGETINQNLSITNGSDDITATAAWVEILAPEGKEIKSSFKVPLSLAPGQTIQIPISYSSAATDQPGIYHIKYSLFSERSILLTSEEEPDGADTPVEFQLQAPAETDSGRFVVSSPPQVGTVKKDIWFSLTSPNQEVFFGEPFAYTFHIFNNSAVARNLTLKGWLPHTNRWHEWAVTATANGETVISGSDLFIDSNWMFETLRAYLYDESGKEIGSYMLSFKGVFPQVTVSTDTAKPLYARGETVDLSVGLGNIQSMASTVRLKVTVTDPANSIFFSTAADVILPAGGQDSRSFSFPLSPNAQGGVYAVSSEVLDVSGKKIGGDTASFTVPLRFVTVAPAVPAILNPGANTVSFTLSNLGTLPVSSGVLNAGLKDPDGTSIGSLAQQFTLDAGQTKSLDLSLSIPPLKFGAYNLTYSQSNEAGVGKNTTASLTNSATIAALFDSPSYRIREKASLTVTLSNSGRFNLENAIVTVTAPDAGFTETRTVNLGQGQSQSLHYALQLPDTLAVGPHTVNVALTLQGGSSVTGSATFTVPQSSLAVSLNQTAYSAGAAVAPAIVNSGGVDTQAQCRLTLYDAKAALMAEKNMTGAVPANGSFAVELPIPGGVTDGNYVLVVACSDLKIGRTDTVQKNLTISGIKATLSLQTDKQAYLSTEGTTALGTIVNGDMALQTGNLHLQVTTAGGSQVKKSWTSQYDFQQGVRKGVDTFSLPDSVSLTSFSDKFDSGFLNTDRWKVSASSAGGAAPTVVNGRLYVEMPNPGNWPASYADTVVPLEGDFDVQVDYQVDTSNNYYNGNNHPAGLTIYQDQPNGIYLWVDIWSNLPGYGTCDSGYTCTNAPDAKYTGKFRITRSGGVYKSFYWSGSSWVTFLTTFSYSRGVGPVYARLIANGVIGNVKTYFDNFTVSTQKYPSSGTLNLKYDAGRSDTWEKLAFSADTPSGTSIKFRTRSSDSESGLTSAAWSSYITTNDSPITSPKGRWIEVEATLSTADKATTPVLREITVTQGHNPGEIIWQADDPVNMAQGATANLSNIVGTIGAEGKYYLQGTLTSSTGQSIATAEYPFFVAQGNTQLTFTTDKRVYKPGETVSVSGEVKNLATVEAVNLNFNLKGQPVGGTEQPLYSATFTLPSGGSRPFSITATAGAEGAFALTGTVTQNASTLAQIADQYEVASPKLTDSLTAPDIAGNDPFAVSLELTNSGKIEASISIGKSFDSQPETVTIPAGQTRLLQYSRQITADTTDTFTISGDLTQVVTKSIKYGPAVNMVLAPRAIYPEGKVAMPVTISNNGLIDSQFTIDYRLDQGSTITSQQAKSYFLAKGTGSADTVMFDLPEGSYQLAAASQKPAAASSATFQVRKEVKAELALSVGTQDGDLLPVAVSVTNLGYNPIEGGVRLALVAENGLTAWTVVQEASLPQTLNPEPRTLAFAINLSTLKPGSYSVRAELLDAGNRQLAARTAPFMLLGPTFVISQLPEYRTIPAGGSSDFTFRVKNSGNQEGQFYLSFKADDLIDSTRSEWLKPGEEKELTFALQTAGDLEEKDYVATWRLKAAGSTVSEGVTTYRLAGLNLTVTASLDKTRYTPGDSAILTLNVTRQDLGAPANLFARANYNGYNGKQLFILSGSQTLVFNVPLEKITGEKLFYGIYAESGRSIHLNTIYIHKADGQLAVTTDRQVYNPGETVAVTSNGSATGDLTLTGPGDYSTSFAFAGTDNRSLVLPSSMAAGTYTIAGKLTAADGNTINVSHPFDVAGIQVKVKEALLDKSRYASTDTMQLTLTIESNRDLAATVRTWVVDPSGTYTAAGEGSVTLTSVAPALFTIPSSLFTASLGIHKLVYGIYQGDLLLASGAKAFDIGEGVLLGLATDRSDYGEVSMPVTVKADLYGASSAGIEFFVDGTSIRSDNVTLNGMGNYAFAIPPAIVTPGLHTLKGVLTVNGLTSSREVRFTYGSGLPDLVVRLSAAQPKGSLLPLAATVTNQGKTAAAATTLVISDGNPEQGGTTVATLAVPPLAAGGSITISHDWQLLGKAGEHTLYGQVDPENRVAEFIEANNRSISSVSVPNLTLEVSTGGASFKAKSDVGIAVNLANLGSAAYQDLTLKLDITGPAGAVGVSEAVVASLAPASEISVGSNWNTGANPPGNYRAESSLLGGGNRLVSGSATFAVEETPSVTGTMSLGSAELIQGSKLGIDYTLANSGNINLAEGETKVEIVDKNSGATVQTITQPFALLNVLQSLTQAYAIERLDVPPGDYTVKLTVTAAGGSFPIDEKALKVLPSLEVIKQFSLASRVLVFIGKEESENEPAQTEATIRQALDGMGVYYAIVRDEKEASSAESVGRGLKK